jgi:hypothetical protein
VCVCVCVCVCVFVCVFVCRGSGGEGVEGGGGIKRDLFPIEERNRGSTIQTKREERYRPTSTHSALPRPTRTHTHTHTHTHTRAV